MDMKYRLSDLQAELVRLLSPFGWQVDREEGYCGWHKDNATTFRFTLTVRAPGHVLDGQRITQRTSKVHREMALYAKDAKFWEYLPYRWAQDVLLGTLKMVEKTKLEAKEMDWRPDGMIPEDFYAM
jgi:hypothetical protein